MRDVHRIARWALLLAVALVPLLMASPALAGTFVYVGNADSHEIYVLRGRPALPQTGRQHVPTTFGGPNGIRYLLYS